jgi:hypothetical protein
VLIGRYRATGADLPFGRPERAHGVPFEGYFWRLVHPERGLVILAIGADCDGWGMATLAAHPGGAVRTVRAPVAVADPYAFGLTVGSALRGDALGVHADLGLDARLDVTLHDVVRWPRRGLGALGLAHTVPGLPQYWHPVVLHAEVRGRAVLDGAVVELDGAVAYAEKNWANAFPGHWWWGHAAAFGERDVMAAFAGGRVRLAGADAAPTAVVVRLGSELLALAPPFARTAVAAGASGWRLRTRGVGGVTVTIEGEPGAAPHVLDVPVPGEHRTEPRSHQHLAGRMTLTVHRRGRLRYRGESPLAGLEHGV